MPRRFALALCVLVLSGFAGLTMGAQCCYEFLGRTLCVESGGGGGGGGGGGPQPTATPTRPPAATATPTPTYPPLPTATNTPAPTPTPVPPDPTFLGFAAYTYKPGNCTDTQAIDPITVVFTGSASELQVLQHAADHGSWGSDVGSTSGSQSFYKQGAGGGCLPMTNQAASGPVGQQPARFHMRFYVYNTNWLLGIIALASAHHEDVDIPCGGSPWGHTVDHNADNGGVSGFDMGRNDVVSNWTAGGHAVVDTAFWNNTKRMKQCDQRESWSNRFVKFVEIN